jgi:ribosome biogenesis protein UTP30
LKSDFRPFEAKRKLCDSYDMFFADKRVVPLLSKLLGKQFLKKKVPVPLDLKHKNWKEQVDNACSSALLLLRTGTCCVVKVARVGMETMEIVENVVAAINGVSEVVPRKWSGIRSLHLKMLESLALPLYQALPDMNVGEGKEVDEEEGKKGKKGGMIHEVNVGKVFDEDILGIHEGNENGEILGSKKRKLGDNTEERVSGVSKGMEKSTKVKNIDSLAEKKNGLVVTKGKKEDGGIKKRKVMLSVEDGNSGEKKDMRKKSGLVKL